MRVLFVTAEAYPLAKTGGLADVSRALPAALACRGIDIRILMPGYPGAVAQIERPCKALDLISVLGISGMRLISGFLPGTGVPVLLLDAPSLFRRDGGLYQNGEGQDWPDNALRFAALSHIAAKLAMGRLGLGWRPDVVHANDWHTGLLPLLIAQEGPSRPGTVFTSHNMAFQGNFPAAILPFIGLSDACLSPDCMEFYGQVSFLKAGLRHGDRITTVSPTYAREALSPEGGCGLDGVLRLRGGDFAGILNGIDDVAWNPATDAHLAQTFRASNIAGKRNCKIALQQESGLAADAAIPLLGFVSRLTHQKMADTILALLPWIADAGVQLIIHGRGERELEAAFAEAQSRYANCVSVRIGYDEAVAHRLQAGCDILLAPARFEPCGLTQLYALRYGTLPVVRKTGGLADTVVDTTPATIADRSATGFVFDDPSLAGLMAALERAIALYREPLAWRRLQLQAMTRDFSWSASAAHYVSLYRETVAPPMQGEDVAFSDDAAESPRQIAL